MPLNRRQALVSLGSVSLAGLLAACGAGEETVTATDGAAAPVAPKGARLAPADFDGAGSCELTAELTEGPYYLDVDRLRSDIREDREGTLLRLGVRVREAGSCEPIENAVVDVWHCDARGGYSGVAGAGGTFLRGAQATDADGIAEFRTIYPGQYPGRATHVHAKVHLDDETVLTTQFFFDPEVDAAVFAREGYAPGGTTNEADGIYDERLGLTLSQDGEDVTGLITLDVRRA